MKASVMPIHAKRRDVEVSNSVHQMPPPDAVLSIARSQKSAPKSLCASDYADSVQALREKGYTWNEIGDFLRDLGAKFSTQAIIAGWRGKYGSK